MRTLSIDFETRSPVDLPKTGVYRYAEDPDTDVWCMAYAFDEDALPRLWAMGEACPADVRAHVIAGGEIRAWNAQFERVVWNYIMTPRYGFPKPRMEQFVCSAVEAAAMALPRSLGAAGAALGTDQQKDKLGHTLMMKMARPRKVSPDGTYVWWEDPEMLGNLYKYCQQDVLTERSIVEKLNRLTPLEREIYLLDQRINDRGVRIDRTLVERAQAIAIEATDNANGALSAATQGQVQKVTNHAKLLKWVREQGHDVDSVDKATVAELMTQDLSSAVRTALVARTEAGRSSVAKLEAMIQAASSDNRIRGMLLFLGATTGRWAGRGVQPQNFPRGSVEGVERFIEHILNMDFDRIDLEYPPVEVVSSLLRGMFIPADNHVFCAADYSAIEARVLNWLAGQEDILQLFREGKDVYKYNAMRLYNIPLEEVQKFPHRQTGKFQELGCGFQMGAKKAVQAAKDVYGLDLVAMEGSEEAALKKARQIVNQYRETHPKVTALWDATNEACKDAIRHPGTPIRFGDREMLVACKLGGYLVIQLPSKHRLYYPAPRIVKAEAPWSKEARREWAERHEAARAAGEPFGELEPEIVEVDNIEFSAQIAPSNAWGRERTYGGKLVENITQAVARDLMAEAMLRAERAGFTPILTVHDEILTEIPKTDARAADVKTFEQILKELPAWAEGCPVDAEGWIHDRYKK